MSKNDGLIAIVGAGRMGRGIAVTFALQGFQVLLIDIKDREKEKFEQLKSEISLEISRHLQLFVWTEDLKKDEVALIISRINVCKLEDQDQILNQVDLLFEAVPEILEVKQQVFERICKYLPHDSIIASTTSSYSVNELAQFITLPERFLNTHWLNPAYLMPLIEVSPGNLTSKESLERVLKLFKKIGKMPVVCGPSPGFIVPRIQTLAMNEAARLVEEGVASIEDVDTASRIGFGLRFAVLGLLEFIDWGGAETLFHASNYMKDSLQTNRFDPPNILQKKISNQELGMQNKKGFYSFENVDISEYQLVTLKKFVDLLKHLELFVRINPTNEK